MQRPYPGHGPRPRRIGRFEGRALREVQRAADDPSFEWSRDLLVGAPRPVQEIPVDGCPLPPHSSAISELMKRAKSVISRPSFELLTVVGGERDQPGLIAAGARIRAASPSIWALTGEPADHGPSPWSRWHAGLTIAARSETPLPTSTAKGFVESGFAGAWHTAPARGGCCCFTHPRMPPSAAASALFARR